MNLDWLVDSISYLSWLDWLGFTSGLIYVLLAARASVWCWPVGLINVLAYFVISYQVKIYSDMGLQVIYLALTIFGWYNWLAASNQENEKELPITKVEKKQWGLFALIFLTLTPLLGFLLDRITDTDVAFWDSSTTVLSLIATWLVAKKKLENWIVWIIVDPIYVGLFWYKGWYLSSILFAIYTFVAISGYFSWQKKMMLQTS